jgi:hypothetical protein
LVTIGPRRGAPRTRRSIHGSPRLAPPVKLVLGLLGLGAVAAVTWEASDQLFENVAAGEIVVMQDPVDGELHVWKTPGLQWQNFGKTTHYERSKQFYFSRGTDGGSGDDSVKARFNDGGEAWISGSLRWDMPDDDEHILALHQKYGQMASVEQDLIRTSVRKAVYMSGPLMSSKESYADRRPDLINFIGDQISRGVYKTIREAIKTTDPITGEEKTVDIVKIQLGDDGQPQRQEASAIEEFGIRTHNLTLTEIAYNETVEKQIAAQQEAIMQVQTAAAEARKAEQQALTAEKEGQAAAAKAKWEQEVIKAQQVTKAEQEKEVARLKQEEAEFYKQEQILRGEGEAARRKLVMQADGALDQKLEAWKEVQLAWAAEIGKQRWVPDIQMGGTSSSGGAQATQLMDLLMAKTAKDLALDLSNQGSR